MYLHERGRNEALGVASSTEIPYVCESTETQNSEYLSGLPQEGGSGRAMEGVINMYWING